ncbi:hypothetical protein CAMGR0001_2025 [Campylobacter gracilis RM3268]|uniref:Uncharacterized protein n=1 Tax=Campylobacter gracilis RM3268 TaxID=553220 RepID=C8PLL4_9BACT|nr:hypothetical protein CAMGR0001_2025 [Campylobacter gracilis RM3268]
MYAPNRSPRSSKVLIAAFNLKILRCRIFATKRGLRGGAANFTIARRGAITARKSVPIVKFIFRSSA